MVKFVSQPLTMLSTGTADAIFIESSDTGDLAGPVITLKRNNPSPDPNGAEYIGQLKFKGVSSTGVDRVYAKITAKIDDPTNQAENGVIEFMNRNNGSEQIALRLKQDSFRTLNDVSLFVAGNTGLGQTSASERLDVLGNIAVSGTVDGRDVSVDGTKLDTVEVDATSDFGGRTGRRQGRGRKLLVIGIGNSNWVGLNSTGPIDRDGDHKPHPKVLEVSRGVADLPSAIKYPSTAGTLSTLTLPTQDCPRGRSNASPNEAYAPTTTPALHALKRLVELDPEIEEVALLTGGLVSSGLVGITVVPQSAWLPDSKWMPGDAHVEDLIDEANAFLEANPDYEFGWLAGQLGPISAFSARTASEFEADLTACINNIRNNVKGGANALFTIHSMEPNMVTVNGNVLTATAGAGTFPEIDAKIMELAGDTPFLSNATAIDVSDLNNGTDNLHHSADDYTEIGRRHADAYVRLRNAQEVQADFEEIRMLPSPYDNNEFRDVRGGGARIEAQVLEFDDEMGWVLRANPANNGGAANGFQTDLQVSNSAHTIFARIKLNQSPLALAALFGGRSPQQAAQADDPDTGTNYGRLITTVGVIYGDTKAAGVARAALVPGFSTGMTQGQWHSLAVVFDGTNFTTYLDGVLAAGPSTTGAAVLTKPSLIELLTYDNNAAGTSAVDGCITDIRVAQKAVDGATMLAWHNDLPPGAATQRDDRILNVPTNNLLGRNSAGTGEVEALTATEAKTILAISSGDVSGLGALATAADATSDGTKYVRQDGAWVSADDTVAAADQTISANRIVSDGGNARSFFFDLGQGTKQAKLFLGPATSTISTQTADSGTGVTTIQGSTNLNWIFTGADFRLNSSAGTAGQALVTGGVGASPEWGGYTVHRGTSAPTDTNMLWYNTTEKELFTYDSGRGHWFGAPYYISMGKTTSTTAGTGHFLYVGHQGTTATTAERGWLVPHDMTITGLRGHTQSTFDGWRFRVDKNNGQGTNSEGVVNTGIMGAVDTYSDFTLDADVNAADIIGMAGVLGSVTLNNTTFTIEVRRRL